MQFTSGKRSALGLPPANHGPRSVSFDYESGRYTQVPNREFDVPDNPILVGWRNRTLPSRDLYEVLQDLDFDSRWRAQFTEKQIDHAALVLERLAALRHIARTETSGVA